MLTGMYEQNTSEYFELIMTELRSILHLEGDDRIDLGQSIVNEILDNGEPIEIKVTHSRKDKFIGNKLFRPMAEIMNTIETIEEISIYVRVFPHTKQNLSRLNYLKYHVSNYLNEIYILKNGSVKSFSLFSWQRLFKFKLLQPFRVSRSVPVL
jgi:hypothetical protein